MLMTKLASKVSFDRYTRGTRHVAIELRLYVAVSRLTKTSAPPRSTEVVSPSSQLSSKIQAVRLRSIRFSYDCGRLNRIP